MKDFNLEFLGMDLQSPFIVGSGPISFSSEGIIRAHRAGGGAIVTKTIRSEAAENPYPHISKVGESGLINAEKWTDISPKRWIEREIPRAKSHGVNLIASVGHTREEVREWVPRVAAAGADAVELVSYGAGSLSEMVEDARDAADLPIIVKISPNWRDPVGSAVEGVQAGADAVTVMDSLGPALRVDIEEAEPAVGGEGGFGWLTGKPIRPLAQAIVAKLAKKIEVPIIGLGGVMEPKDAMEMLMVGSSVVGICTTLLLNGIDYLEKLTERTLDIVSELGYSGISEVSGAALDNLPVEENSDEFRFEYLSDECVDCRKCVELCPYEARSLEDKEMDLDEDKCRYCGLCGSVCPTGALRTHRAKD